MSKMVAFDVYLPVDHPDVSIWEDPSYSRLYEGLEDYGELVLIDTVFYIQTSWTDEEAKESLVEHDGYPDEIIVRIVK